jgi:hypothetical protein
MTDVGGPHGYLDAQNAGTYGLHSPDPLGLLGPIHPTGGGGSPAKTTHESQCMGPGRTRLGKNFEAANSTLPDSLWNMSASSTLADTRVLAADVAWSACVRSAGFRAKNPAEPARAQVWARMCRGTRPKSPRHRRMWPARGLRTWRAG